MTNLFTSDDFSDPIDVGPGIRTRVIVRGELMFSLIELDENAVSAIHHHPEVQMGLVLEGSFERHQDGEVKLLHEGDGFYVPPNVPHGGKAVGGPCRILDVFSPPRERYLRETR